MSVSNLLWRLKVEQNGNLLEYDIYSVIVHSSYGICQLGNPYNEIKQYTFVTQL